MGEGTASVLPRIGVPLAFAAAATLIVVRVFRRDKSDIQRHSDLCHLAGYSALGVHRFRMGTLASG